MSIITNKPFNNIVLKTNLVILLNYARVIAAKGLEKFRNTLQN